MLDCALKSWSPGIGDPTAMGWLTVGVYALAALLAAMVVRRYPFPARSRWRERAFWTASALLLAALAVNKELDLQSFFTSIGRCLAREEGWYDARQGVQTVFIKSMIWAAAAILSVLLVFLRGTWRRSFVPLVGLVFVTTFVVVRAAGFHHMDRLIGRTLGETGIRMNWALELPGPILVAVAALVLLCLARSRGTFASSSPVSGKEPAGKRHP